MNPYLGEIRLFAGAYAPKDWALCNGSEQKISENQNLFNLIGTTYGGDGKTTFLLPDLRGRVIVSQGNNYPIASAGGKEMVTLDQNTLPAHKHGAVVSSLKATSKTIANGLIATPVDPLNPDHTAIGYVSPQDKDFTLHQLAPGTIEHTGGNQPHENRMPFVAISYIIALYGDSPYV